jgi:hypothetical protein
MQDVVCMLKSTPVLMAIELAIMPGLITYIISAFVFLFLGFVFEVVRYGSVLSRDQ